MHRKVVLAYFKQRQLCSISCHYMLVFQYHCTFVLSFQDLLCYIGFIPESETETKYVILIHGFSFMLMAGFCS